jgi:uncharacterized protein YdaU (DUF1376 family)
MRTPDTFCKIYFGDLAVATEGLPLNEWAAVNKIIHFYWQHGTLPDDKSVLRLLGVGTKQWKVMRDDVMDAFEAYKRRSRLDDTMQSAVEMTELNRRKALKSVEVRRQRMLAELGVEHASVDKPGLSQTETETETEQKEGIAAAELTPKAQTYPGRAEHVNEGLNGRPVELHEGGRGEVGLRLVRSRVPDRH